MRARNDEQTESTLDLGSLRELRLPGLKSGTLTLLTGPVAGALFPLDAPTVRIGRAPDGQNEVVIPEPCVSRKHARVDRLEPGRYRVEDLGSRNGTFVNGDRLRAPRELAHGDRLQLGGDVLLGFALLDPLERSVCAQRFEQGTRDPLSGLYNRRIFLEHLQKELSFAQRHGTDLALLLVDIDHFKQVNDRYGHLAGDRLIGVVAGTLSEDLRTEDLVARYGGEEFAVVLRCAGLDGSVAVAERIRRRVAEVELVWQGQRVTVTASIGLAHVACGGDASALIAAADAALYAAKREGRNCVRSVQFEGSRRVDPNGGSR